MASGLQIQCNQRIDPYGSFPANTPPSTAPDAARAIAQTGIWRHLRGNPSEETELMSGSAKGSRTIIAFTDGHRLTRRNGHLAAKRRHRPGLRPEAMARSRRKITPEDPSAPPPQHRCHRTDMHAPSTASSIRAAETGVADRDGKPGESPASVLRPRSIEGPARHIPPRVMEIGAEIRRRSGHQMRSRTCATRPITSSKRLGADVKIS